MPPKRPLVSDDEDAYDDLDELMSSDEEEIKPGDIKQILKGSLSAAHHRTMTMKTLHGKSVIYRTPAHQIINHRTTDILTNLDDADD